MRAAGHEVEQGYPFAVIHQVCEALRGRYGAALDEAGGGPESLRALFQRAAASQGTSARVRSEVLYAVHWFLASAAEHAPLLLCLDDLHWADPDSLEAQRFLALRLAGLPLACALARTCGDPAVRARAQTVWSHVAFNLGRPEALDQAHRALDELPVDAEDETADLWGWSVPVAAGMICMRAERYGEAETLLQAAAARARARGARSAHIWAATFLTELEWSRGRLRAAFAHAAFAHREATTLYPGDIPWAMAMFSSIRARLLLDMGDLAGAEGLPDGGRGRRGQGGARPGAPQLRVGPGLVARPPGRGGTGRGLSFVRASGFTGAACSRTTR